VWLAVTAKCQCELFAFVPFRYSDEGSDHSVIRNFHGADRGFYPVTSNGLGLATGTPQRLRLGCCAVPERHLAESGCC